MFVPVMPDQGHRIRRGVYGCLLTLAMLAIAPQLAAAAGWSTVGLPEHSGLNAVFCRSSRWCEGVGTNYQAQAEHWNGSRWSVGRSPAQPKHSLVSIFSGVSCTSNRSCVAVGDWTTRENGAWDPLIERWNGSRWSIQHAVKPATPQGYRSAHTYLNAIACRGPRFCLAVGNLVPVGAGNAPGTPVTERWNGSHWQLQSTPQAIGPLDSVSCASSSACTAVGGWSATVGPDGAPVYDSVTERWSGTRWSLQSLPTPAGTTGDGLLGVSCPAAQLCLGAGSAQYDATQNGSVTPGADQAVAGEWPGTVWSTQTLNFPAGTYRSGTGPPPAPEDRLYAVSCATSESCAAVGQYVATNGDIGPLAANWNGSAWTQTVLRRGPVALKSISCPSSDWCMAVGPVAERYSG